MSKDQNKDLKSKKDALLHFEEYMIEDFKKDKFYFSYSSLQKLANDPKEFYKNYILKERDDKDTKILKQGQLFHCFVLEPENFDEKFMVLNSKVPSPGPKSVIDNVYEKCLKHKIEADPKLIGTVSLDTYNTEIIEELVEVDLYQGLVDAKRATDGVKLTGDQKRLEKIVTPDNNRYFLSLQEGEAKTIVDMDMVTIAKRKAEVMLENPLVQSWLSPNSIKIDVRKELQLKNDIPGYKFGLKGFIDTVVIDMENEVISIIDFKTTSKSLNAWYESFMTSEYMYWMQPIVYKELIMSLVPEKSKRAWKLKVFFPVIDKNDTVYVFPVSPKSLVEWEVKTKNVLEIAKWHMSTMEFDMPYMFAKGLVKL